VKVELGRVRRFWEEHVNNEYFTRHGRGTPEYFAEIERRRYASHYHLPELFERLRPIAPGRRLLEVGCGIGVDTFRLARLGFAEVVGIDLTAVAVRLVAERARREGLGTVRLGVGDAEALAFADGSFDVVYSFGVLHHTPRIERAVAEVHRVLAPGGLAVVMLYHSWSLVNLVHRLLRLPFESPRTLEDTARWCTASAGRRPGSCSPSLRT
jgi:ubiquinone/menaquinone biosynthesis C-methylase UbiE